MSYRPKIDPKSRKAARFISHLQRKIQKALVESGKTQQEVATILGVDRSVVNKRLKGSANLTARSIAEFAYALDREIEFDLVEQSRSTGNNLLTSKPRLIELDDSRSNVSTGVGQMEKKYSIESVAA